MVSSARRQGAVEAWASKHPFLAMMSGQSDLRAEGERVAGARSPFRTLYGGTFAGLAVGVFIAFAAIRLVAEIWSRFGTLLLVIAGIAAAAVLAVVALVRWWRNPLRGIRI